MPTFQEIEEIKQAHVQSLIQGKARLEAMQASAAAARLSSSASLSVSPFGVAQDKQHAGLLPDAGKVASGASMTIQPGIATTRPADAVDAETSLPGIGLAVLAVCVLLYLLVRRLWD